MPVNRVGGPSSYNVICDDCGLKYKNYELKKRPEDNAMVCKDCWEPRHPQHFVRAKQDNTLLPYLRPDSDADLTYTPTWGLIDSLGDGTLEGLYTQRTDSDGNSVIEVTIRAEIGSTTTFNVGTWTISVPVTNGANASDGTVQVIAKNRLYRGKFTLAAAASTFNILDQEDNRIWSNTIPQTWSDGDTFFLTIRYSTE